jgi:hypothetical protein
MAANSQIQKWVPNEILAKIVSMVSNAVYVSGLIAQATTTSAVKTVTNTIVYSIGGKLATKAPTDNFWTLAEAATVAATVPPKGSGTLYYGRVFLHLIDLAGTGPLTVASELYSSTSSTLVDANSQSIIKAPEYDMSTYACVGYTKVINGHASTLFTPGTTAIVTSGALVVSMTNTSTVFPGQFV